MTAPPAACEAILAHAVVDVLTDLRQIDYDRIADLILRQSHSNIADLVTSAAELFFRADALSYAWSSGLVLLWEEQPQLFLDLEFRFEGLFCIFRAQLSTTAAAVALKSVVFDGPVETGEEALAVFRRAVHRARLHPLIVRRPDLIHEAVQVVSGHQFRASQTRQGGHQ